MDRRVHFKCVLRRIADYPNLSGYVRDLKQQHSAVATVTMEQIKNDYNTSHETVNPSRVVPMGPVIDYSAPHDRAELGKGANNE